jgi:hypothetical protein
MIDTNDYCQLEALFGQEHEELIKPVKDEVAIYFFLIRELESDTSKYWGARLAEAISSEDRADIQVRMINAHLRETNQDHPDNWKYTKMRMDAVERMMARYWPVIEARRKFSEIKRIDLLGAEKEFFVRFGAARENTHLHNFVTAFERATDSQEQRLTRHVFPGFNTLIPDFLNRFMPTPSSPSDLPLERESALRVQNGKAAKVEKPAEVPKPSLVGGFIKKVVGSAKAKAMHKALEPEPPRPTLIAQEHEVPGAGQEEVTDLL